MAEFGALGRREKDDLHARLPVDHNVYCASFGRRGLGPIRLDSSLVRLRPMPTSRSLAVAIWSSPWFSQSTCRRAPWLALSSWLSRAVWPRPEVRQLLLRVGAPEAG
jgi:hypothetical protein